ncbi:unnamed protein product [Cylicocyclus nassatus]|uniref:Uncharacterized protein n=1 Tax=Cylicocyclus nassatus TaxID=53992 RepID=A0AA36DQ38_CYLNA|nr:unnamed protein product [Cylicocyclus nassatus]
MPATKLVSGAGPEPPLPDGFCNEKKKTPSEAGYDSLQWRFSQIRQTFNKEPMARTGWTDLENDAMKCFENPGHCVPVYYAITLPPDGIALLAEKTYIVPLLQV